MISQTKEVLMKFIVIGLCFFVLTFSVWAGKFIETFDGGGLAVSEKRFKEHSVSCLFMRSVAGLDASSSDKSIP